MEKIPVIALLCGLLAGGVPAAYAAEDSPAPHAAEHSPAAHAAEPSPMPELQLSAETRTLLQAEMREIASGVQVLTTALSTADWKTLQSTATSIRDSYIFARQLSAEQRKELLYKLPNGFRVLDRDFHRRADRLAAAAEVRDGDLATFYFYRLMDSCVACHSQYVGGRFPGFNVVDPEEHQH